MASGTNPFRKSKAVVRDHVFGPLRKERHMRLGLLLNKAKRVDVRDLVLLLESHSAQLGHRRQQNFYRGLAGALNGDLWRALTPADRIRIMLPKNITPLMALDVGMLYGVSAEDIMLEHAKDLLEMYRKNAALMCALQKRHTVKRTSTSEHVA